MDFSKYYDDLVVLKSQCDNSNTGLISNEYRADSIRVKNDDVKHFYEVVDDSHPNMWIGDEVVPFDDDEWKHFWFVTKQVFPLFSVNLRDSIEESQDDEKRRFLKAIRYYEFIMGMFLSKEHILEIGCGYGGVGKHLILDKIDYYGIDYCLNCDELKDYKNADGVERFIEIDKSGVPDILKSKKFDLIYSSNVFQHITHQQKIDYFKEVSQLLNDKGLFYFDVFSWNYDYDKKIRDGYSCKFFIVETKIETEKEIEKMLNECGLKIVLKNNNPYGIKSDSENKPIGYYCSKI